MRLGPCRVHHVFEAVVRAVASGLLLVVLFAFPVAQAQEMCLDCHSDSTLTGRNAFNTEVGMYVDSALFHRSSHGSMACTDCHADLAGVTDFPHAEQLRPVDCGTCHDDVAQVYKASFHGIVQPSNPRAPTCASCHTAHDILPAGDPHASTNAVQLPKTCGRCHNQNRLNEDPDIRIPTSIDDFMLGVHARGLAKGVAMAATCNDCHGMHDIRQAADPLSPVNKLNIHKTCGKCHGDVMREYLIGVHGKALMSGVTDAPTCSDCHGQHNILSPDDPTSPTNRAHLAQFVCGSCHSNPLIIEKYGFGGHEVQTYYESYHGLATKGGSLRAATCVSCHEAHATLPQQNPLSTINRDNLVQTCRQCHPKADLAFASSYSHKVSILAQNKLDAIVRSIYIGLIIAIVGSMMAHNLIIFFRHVVDKHRKMKGVKMLPRFTPNMVFQHLVLTIAFLTLVVTGFALKYPNDWWVGILNFFGIFESTRSVVHRIAAVLLIYTSLHHIMFILWSRRAREEFRAIIPNRQDLRDAVLNMKYHLGLGKELPRFDRYDYTEKGEYWALVWGTLIMILTGLILWFPTRATAFLPGWVIKLSETVHFYEAWLATLAIFIWHLFFVIFHPDEYPMSLTWITGKISEKACKEKHPRWYERITAAEADRAAPEQPGVDRSGGSEKQG